MASAKQPTKSAAKVRAHRARLRAKGLRPIQFWVPDVESEAFRAEARRQCLAIVANGGDADDQAFIDSISAGIWDNEPYDA